MGDLILKENFDLESIKLKNDFYSDKYYDIKMFDDLPLTTKDELLKNQVKYPPYGNFRDNDILIEQIYRTSGTTSKPLMLSFSKYDIEYITDIGADCFRYSGMGSIGNKEIVINCLNLSMWAGGFFDAQSMMKTGVQVINFGTGNTNELIKLILDLSLSFKVSLHCTPSYLPIIEKRFYSEFKKYPRDLNLFKLYLGAEGGIQNNEFRNNLIKKWDCGIYNANYGMSEICSIMASANDENMLKFSEKLFESYYVELNIDNRLINILDANIDEQGELVISSFNKESQPLIRYSTKEKIKIVKKENKSIFFEVIGRSDDMIVVKGINFFPEQLRSVISEFKELSGQYQLQIHKNNNNEITDVNLICELSNEEHKLDNKTLRDKLIYKIRNELTVSVDVNFTYKFEILGNKLKLINIVKG
ncbi:phenylacetate--CoA ligase family protein [Candidatus Marinarcus aquaticus]|uniref:AMP-dependent ligase C-terminal domain-containing protein n=1 Tax=Candidatus Marinarcus aquaticus TaxID=2044504 RepID=A0A4Q0XM33_9BACT|nr:phenylacetate--CoA ligase family protein [Candidatus Marinarcus aquaticus]RXJ54425.1 hypothetical protein CRV04_11570 [Candidatus Marinarcus aquaticus]